jgi:hypothetical protein
LIDKLRETLGSRKFLLTIGGIITVIGTPGLTPMERMQGIIALIAQFCVAQGVVDAAEKFGVGKSKFEAGTGNGGPEVAPPGTKT